MPIQVFPPLTLEPRNITLIIGAKFQVQVYLFNDNFNEVFCTKHGHKIIPVKEFVFC